MTAVSDEMERLKAAIDLITEVHTRDDPDFGFVVIMGATPDPLFGSEGTRIYVDSWATLRKHIGKPSEPSAQDKPKGKSQ